MTEGLTPDTYRAHWFKISLLILILQLNRLKQRVTSHNTKALRFSQQQMITLEVATTSLQ